MNENTRQWLRDALTAAEMLVQQAGRQTFDGYLADQWFRAATERHLEIIGEALNRVRREEPAIAERVPRIHEWVALRNVVSHLYDRVDAQIIWDTLNDDLPLLIETLRHLLTLGPDSEDMTK